MQPRILLPLAAAALVFAAPAAANAAVTPAIAGNAVTLNGDNTADNILLRANAAGLLTHNITGNAGLADETDFDPAPGPAVTTPASAATTVTINASGGNDTINLSNVPLNNATVINGDAGDDIIVGSGAAEVINGGAGADRITGFDGNDTVNGGTENDLMQWNNGDDNDINNGGDGNDETLITAGTADDNMLVEPNGQFTRFRRVNGPFTVDMLTVERLVITSFSGNDTLTPAAGITLPMNVDAGSGDDNITTGGGADVVSAGDGNDTVNGGEGADLLNGGDGNDTLNGQGGGDRIVGDRNADTMRGGEGDDTAVWNNGDGSDVIDGENGVDRVETNLSGVADTSTLKVENGRVRYDRLNPGPFNLSIATSEYFELNTLAGDDTLTTEPGLPISVIADGGSGNDNFAGGDEADTFFGAAGDDTLTGGNGSDTVDGGEGNDTLAIRDDAGDLARGGSGADAATVDALDAVATDVETVNRPVVQPNPGPGAPKLTLSANVRRGFASVRLECPAGTTGCAGDVSLLAAKAVKKQRVKLNARFGRAPYSLQAGESKTFRIRVSGKAAKIAKRKRLVVRARVTSAAGPAQTAKLTLRF
jgi:Ca2+-binding RTX toxin-like protein